MTHDKKKVDPVADPEETPGTGALCPEAQADGVPCFEKGRECDACGKAFPVDGPDGFPETENAPPE